MGYVEVRGVRIGEGMPKICVPIVGMTREEILKEAGTFSEIPLDLVEWRVDWYEDAMDTGKVLNTAKALREVLGEIPVLFTFRTAREGGEKAITIDEYAELNKSVAESGFVDLIDVEAFLGENSLDDLSDYKNVRGEQQVRSLIHEIHVCGGKVVASNHDFTKTPSKDVLVQRLCYMQQLGADIPKIAVMPQNKKDVLTLLCATEEMVSSHEETPVITMSMSATGVISRICGETFGSALTFGAAKKASAPGQMGVNDLYEVLEIIHNSL